MGLTAKKQKADPVVAPVDQADPRVKAAGAAELERLRSKKGRASTMFSNPNSNVFGINTGSVTPSR